MIRNYSSATISFSKY